MSVHTHYAGRRDPLVVALSVDGLSWTKAVELEVRYPFGSQERRGYSSPAVIQASDGLVHIVYTWRRERIKHVVIDPRNI